MDLSFLTEFSLQHDFADHYLNIEPMGTPEDDDGVNIPNSSVNDQEITTIAIRKMAEPISGFLPRVLEECTTATTVKFIGCDFHFIGLADLPVMDERINKMEILYCPVIVSPIGQTIVTLKAKFPGLMGIYSETTSRDGQLVNYHDRDSLTNYLNNNLADFPTGFEIRDVEVYEMQDMEPDDIEAGDDNDNDDNSDDNMSDYSVLTSEDFIRIFTKLNSGWRVDLT